MVRFENLFVFANTRNRNQTAASAAVSDFTFPISHIADRVGEATFHLHSGSFPNTMYPISAARQNNKLYFQEDGSTVTTFIATLGDNAYTGSQFASALQTAMNAAGAAHTYTVSYDSQSLKITIVSNGTSVKIITGSNITGSTSMEKEIGADTTQAFSQTYVCAYPVNLSGTKYIDIDVSNFSNSNVSSTSALKPLYRIYLDAPFGAITFAKAHQPEEVRVRVTELQNMRIQFLDDKSLPISLPLNHDISLVFKLTYTYGH